MGQFINFNFDSGTGELTVTIQASDQQLAYAGRYLNSLINVKNIEKIKKSIESNNSCNCEKCTGEKNAEETINQYCEEKKTNE